MIWYGDRIDGSPSCIWHVSNPGHLGSRKSVKLTFNDRFTTQVRKLYTLHQSNSWLKEQQSQVIFHVRKKRSLQSLKELSAIAVADIHRFALLLVVGCPSTLSSQHCQRWQGVCEGRPPTTHPGSWPWSGLGKLLDNQVHAMQKSLFLLSLFHSS